MAASLTFCDAYIFRTLLSFVCYSFLWVYSLYVGVTNIVLLALDSALTTVMTCTPFKVAGNSFMKVNPGLRGQLGPILIVIWITMIQGASAVTCHSCKDSIAGCKGGASCPLLIRCAANVVALAAGTLGILSVKNLIPTRFTGVFTRAVLDRLTYLASNSHTTLAFDPTGKDPTEIYNAVVNGRLAKTEANTALMQMMQAATITDSVRGAISATMNAVHTISVKSVEDGSKNLGLHLFVVAASLKQVASTEHHGSTSLGTEPSSSASNTPNIKLVAPTSEASFHEMLLVFVMICHAVGVSDALVTTAFISKVVHERMRRRNYTWMMAYEIFVVLLCAIDETEDDSISMVNITSDGGFDGHADDAEAAGRIDYGSSFRKLRVEPRDVNTPRLDADGNTISASTGNKAFNGIDTPSANKACISFNRGANHPQKSLRKDGSCRFKHVCFHWVTGKGKDGICGSASHAWGACDHADKCDAAVA